MLASGRSSHRLVRAYKSVLGWIPGGMAIMVVIVCAVFTTFTGASGVTILALGGLVYPMLVRDGYPKGFRSAWSRRRAVWGCCSHRACQ